MSWVYIDLRLEYSWLWRQTHLSSIDNVVRAQPRLVERHKQTQSTYLERAQTASGRTLVFCRPSAVGDCLARLYRTLGIPSPMPAPPTSARKMAVTPSHGDLKHRSLLEGWIALVLNVTTDPDRHGWVHNAEYLLQAVVSHWRLIRASFSPSSYVSWQERGNSRSTFVFPWTCPVSAVCISTVLDHWSLQT